MSVGPVVICFGYLFGLCMCCELLGVQGDPVLILRSKDQETELTRQSLAALSAMRIRFPGKTEEEAEAALDEACVCVCVRACVRESIYSVSPKRDNGQSQPYSMGLFLTSQPLHSGLLTAYCL